MFNQGSSVSSHIYNYMLQRSDPKVFSVQSTIQDHSLVPDIIVSGLQERCPSLKFTVIEEMSHLEVDDFVREVDGMDSYDVVSFLIQCSYKDLSPTAKKYIYDKVVEHSVLVDGKYFCKHPNA